MHLLRFLVLVLVLIGILTSCAVAVALIFLAFHCWPLLLILILAISLFGWLLDRVRLSNSDAKSLTRPLRPK
jgi:hypothetical protein